MKLLHVNDVPGEHAPSLYAARAGVAGVAARTARPRLERDATADTCIVGAGYTGLSAALHLGRAGHDTLVLEAHRAGWGASGRNGGQLGTGFNRSPDALAAMIDEELALGAAKLAEGLPRADVAAALIGEGVPLPDHSADPAPPQAQDTPPGAAPAENGPDATPTPAP